MNLTTRDFFNRPSEWNDFSRWHVVAAGWIALQFSLFSAAAQSENEARDRGQAEAARLRSLPQAGEADPRIEKLLRDQPAARPGSRHKSLRTADFLVEGPGHHLWGRQVEGHAFAEWDGKTWQARPCPEAVAFINLLSADLLTDSHDQAWILPFEFDRTVVFGFASGQWEVFETLDEAVARKLVPGDALTKSYHSVNRGPVSHANGTKAFIHFDGRVHVLQQGHWHRTTCAELGAPNLALRGMPFFNQAGLFSIPYGEDLFACTGDGQWEKIPVEKPKFVPLARVIPQPPSGGWGVLGTDIISFCWDRTGAAWLATSTLGLIKWRDGIARQLLDMVGPLSLRQGASFPEVLLDSAGNAFLRYDGYDLVVHYEFVGAKPAGAVPTARWEPGKGGNGSVRLEGLDAGFQRWRLGKGEWSKLGQESVIPLTELFPDSYEIMVECFNDELSLLGSPVMVKFTIQGLTPLQIKAEITRLRSPEPSVREDAAGVLRSQGASTLEALREARLESPEDESFQWWLQALIQNIESKKSKTNSKEQ